MRRGITNQEVFGKFADLCLVHFLAQRIGAIDQITYMY